jgi:hypothetical protein
MVKWIVEDCVAYHDQYIPAGVSFDMAACQLQGLPGLAKALRELTDQLNSHIANKRMSDIDKDVRDMVVLAHWRAQSYKFEQYTDLWDFANELVEVAGRSGRSQDLKDIVTACRHVKTAVTRVVTDHDHCGAEFQHSHGLSVYFPWSRQPFDGDDDLARYGEMTFPEASGWHDFLKACLDGTRREELKVSGATQHLTRFGRQWPAQADSTIRAAEGVNRAAERVNRAAERVNRAAERVNRYNDLLMQLYGGPGRRLPWSMKNPPQGVQWAPKNP